MWEDLVNKYAVQFEVPALWIAAVIQTESNGDPAAIRPEPKIKDASYGLMQLLYSTAQNLGYSGTPEGLFDPDTNIYFGTKLLRQLIDRYGTDPQRIYSAYNSGRPDLFRSSSQVAHNVARFMSALEELATEFANSPVVQHAVGPVAAGVLITVLLLLWRAN